MKHLKGMGPNKNFASQSTRKYSQEKLLGTLNKQMFVSHCMYYISIISLMCWGLGIGWPDKKPFLDFDVGILNIGEIFNSIKLSFEWLHNIKFLNIIHVNTVVFFNLFIRFYFTYMRHSIHPQFVRVMRNWIKDH